MDAHLFDLTYLLDHGRAGGNVPVTVHYGKPSTASKTAAAVDALPGSDYVDGTATNSHATVAVKADARAAFWNAVTQPRSYAPDDPKGWPWRNDESAAPRELAPGVAGLTLDGAPLEKRHAPTATNTDRLTFRVHASEDRTRWLGPEQAQEAALPYLTGVTGPWAKASVEPSSISCPDTQCRIVEYAYDVPSGAYWSRLSAGGHREGRYTVRSFAHNPEVVVRGDTTLDIHLDDGIWIEPKTPRPAEMFERAATETRTYPDGYQLTTLSWTADAVINGGGYYLVPTQWPARTGSYNLVWTHNMRQPKITMELAGRGGDRELHSLYSGGVSYPAKYLNARDKTFEVVDAGYGSEADFDAIDAEGKLILLAPDPDLIKPDSPHFQHEVMQRAEQHGAAAVIGDPNCPFPGPYSDPCYVPMAMPGYYEDVPVLTSPPLITVSPSNATRLRGLLAGQAPVRVTVDSPPVGQSEYFYSKAWHFAGGVPVTIDQDFGPDEFVTRKTRFHGVKDGDAASLGTTSFVASQHVLAGGSVDWAVGAGNREVDLYLSTDTDIIRDVYGLADARPRERAGEVFSNGAESRQQEFGEVPRAVGPRIPQSFNPDNRIPWMYCSFCRMDDLVYPYTTFNVAAEPHHQGGEIGLLPNVVLTDAAGDAIPQTVRSGSLPLPVYELPPGRQRYNLTSEFTGGSTFAWTFTSGSVDEDNRPTGTTCLQEAYLGELCGEALPMIYLRYDAPVDLDNTATAGTWQTVKINPYHHGPDAPAITQLTTEVSFDSGQTWRPAQVWADRDGTRQVSFAVPKLADTDGYVTLRTNARDAAGNSTVQTLVKAYGLHAPPLVKTTVGGPNVTVP